MRDEQEDDVSEKRTIEILRKNFSAPRKELF